MLNYCTRCHASTLNGPSRSGAPLDHDFDTLELIRAVNPEHIDAYAAAGPSGIHTLMPPSGPAPTEVERRRLGEWLACGTP